MKIAIDFDMVLVDNIPMYKKIFKKHNKKMVLPNTWNFGNWNVECRNDIISEFKKNPPDLMIKLKPFRYAKKFIRYLKKQGHYVEIVTSRVVSFKNYKYIAGLFSKVNHIEIIGLNGKKAEYIKDHNFDVWIDDYPQECGELINSCKILLISNKNTKYNWYLRSGFQTFKNVKEIMKSGMLNGNN
jgi:hypothetical protein